MSSIFVRAEESPKPKIRQNRKSSRNRKQSSKSKFYREKKSSKPLNKFLKHKGELPKENLSGHFVLNQDGESFCEAVMTVELGHGTYIR